jgi:hypothetical protein
MILITLKKMKLMFPSDSVVPRRKRGWLHTCRVRRGDRYSFAADNTAKVREAQLQSAAARFHISL